MNKCIWDMKNEDVNYISIWMILDLLIKSVNSCLFANTVYYQMFKWENLLHFIILYKKNRWVIFSSKFYHYNEFPSEVKSTVNTSSFNYARYIWKIVCFLFIHISAGFIKSVDYIFIPYPRFDE